MTTDWPERNIDYSSAFRSQHGILHQSDERGLSPQVEEPDRVEEDLSGEPGAAPATHATVRVNLAAPAAIGVHLSGAPRTPNYGGPPLARPCHHLPNPVERQPSSTSVILGSLASSTPTTRGQFTTFCPPNSEDEEEEEEESFRFFRFKPRRIFDDSERILPPQ